MKKNVVLGIVTLMTVSATYTMPVHAEEGYISNVLSSVGVEEVFELDKTEAEFIEAVGPVELYGYSNIGIADVFSGCPKHTAVEILTRTMSPEVIICDEITASVT